MKSNRSQECANASENLTRVRIGDAEVTLGGVRERRECETEEVAFLFLLRQGFYLQICPQNQKPKQSNETSVAPHLAPAGESPFHTQLLVTGLGVHGPFGQLSAHVIGHRGRNPRCFQLLTGHPACLDASTTAPCTGRPGGHHPPEEKADMRAIAEDKAWGK